MSFRYPAGLITANSPVNANYPSGVWTPQQAYPYIANNVWGDDPYFNQTVLLLHGDGTNGAQNNTFLDSSTNNFTITRNGDTTQGTFSPFSVGAGEWSNYFDGTGDYLTAPQSLTDNSFTVEGWFYSGSTALQTLFCQAPSGSTTSETFSCYLSSGAFYVQWGSSPAFVTAAYTLNAWNYFAASYDQSTETVTGYLNGSSIGTFSAASRSIGNYTTGIGHRNTTNLMVGYISNLRVVNGTALTISGVPTAPLTAITNTSLLTCQSNRFVDNSSSPKTITRNGDVRVTPFSPFQPAQAYSPAVTGGSGYFDGTGDYLSGIGTTSSFNFLHNLSAKFTFQAWIYLTASGSSYVLIDTTGNSSSNVGLVLNITSSNQIGLVITRGVNGSFVFTGNSTGAVTPFAWNHVAVTYDQSLGSSNAVFYINGVQSGTGNKTANAPSSSNATYALACAGSATGGQVFSGYITGLQISNSVDSITVPTAPLAPAASTNLLLNFTNAGILDNTNKNVLETEGNAQIDTSIVKYGTGSMEFDGTGDYLVAPNSLDYNFGAGAFTIEMWVNFTAAASGTAYFLLAQALAAFTPNAGWSLLRSTSNNLRFVFSVDGGSSNYYAVNTSFTPTTGTWYHIAITRSGSTFRMFIDGDSKTLTTDSAGSGSASASIFNSTRPLYIGSTADPGNYFNGYIDDLRITKGVARYTANFIPPIARMPNQ